ncbi:MAG: hypothetical protein NUW00_04110 [Candidatus Kaiserbacteria bacterium]|nr:hypothetical protein [Candidatus Kaiserbacteria bacterium]
MKKTVKKLRKTKYVVWLHNHTSRKDDEWKTVWAIGCLEAGHEVEGVDFTRFSISHIWTIKEFRHIYGKGFPV